MIKLKILVLLFGLSSCSQASYKSEIDISQLFMRLVEEGNYAEAKRLLEENYSNFPGIDTNLGIASSYLKQYGLPSTEKVKITTEAFLGVEMTVLRYELTNNKVSEKHTFVISIGKSKYAGKIVTFSIEHKSASILDPDTK